MDNIQSPPEVSPVMVLPPREARRAACTHTSLRRHYGAYRCTHCNFISRFGWVYHCNQDHETEQRLARLSNVEEPTSSDLEKPSSDETIDNNTNATKPQLSAWIEQAISQGQYTAEQTVLMRKQRQKVLDCIAATEAALTKEQQEQQVQKEPMEQDELATPVVSTMARDSYPVSILFRRNSALIPEATSVLEQPVIQPSPHGSSATTSKHSQECTYTSCQFCRPTMRDRAWQSFGNIFEITDVEAVMDQTMAERPVSDFNNVLRIGLRKKRPRLRTFDSKGVPFVDNHGMYPLSRCSSHDVKLEDEGYESGEIRLTRSRGFRATLRRAFRGLVKTRSSSRSSKRSDKSKNSEESEYSKTSSLSTEWSSRQDEGTNSYGNTPVDSDEDMILLQAMRTELPANNDDKDDIESLKDISFLLKDVPSLPKDGAGSTMTSIESLKDGVVHVDHGIAVTEEAINLGTADIITQV